MNRAAREEDASASSMEVGSGCADAAGAESKPRGGGGTGEAAGGGCKCGAGGGSGDLLDSAYGSTETNMNVRPNEMRFLRPSNVSMARPDGSTCADSVSLKKKRLSCPVVCEFDWLY